MAKSKLGLSSPIPQFSGNAATQKGFNYPTLNPPSAGSGGGATAWNSGVRVTSTWSIAENRNFWIHFSLIGWRKCADNSDSAAMAFGMLACSARQTNAPVNYLETDDAQKQVTQIYVW